MNRSPAARILFKDGATGCPETPEQNLLRRRIRIATVVMLLVKVALMIRNFVTYGAPPVMDYAIVVALIAATGWLYSPRNASLLALRTVETIIFLALSAHLGLVLNEDLKHSMQLHGKVARGVWFVAAIKDQIIATFGMMMIYGMFIPNRARRAALMVSLMAVVPAIVIFIAIIIAVLVAVLIAVLAAAVVVVVVVVFIFVCRMLHRFLLFLFFIAVLLLFICVMVAVLFVLLVLCFLHELVTLKLFL